MLTTALIQRQAAQLAKPGRHAVIIGSGLGGLAAAIRLGATGYRVTVLEKLYGPGGRVSVFKQNGCRFEPLFTQRAWFRPHNKSEDVERLNIAGAGTHPRAGALCSAKTLDQVVPHAALL